MQIRLGGAPPPTDLVGALLACHERIRTFCALARTIARTEGAPAAEVADAAARVRRYFVEALPLHVADEDDTLAPLLAGRDPDVDRALARMHAEHEAHAPLLAELIALTDRLARAPDDLAAVRPALAAIAARVEDELAAHLALEEEVVIPAIARLLTDAERAGAQAAARARRAP